MASIELSAQEQRILDMIREPVPYEEIRIVKDQLGRPNHFFVVRTQKIVINTEKVVAGSV